MSSARIAAALNRPIWHRNMTLGKLLSFCAISGVGAGVLAGLTFIFTDLLGFHYLVSMIMGSGIATLIKFVLNALFTFRGDNV